MWNFPHSRVAQLWRGQLGSDMTHAPLCSQLTFALPTAEHSQFQAGISPHLWSSGVKEGSPGMEKGGSWMGYLHPDGAVLSPDRCLEEMGSAETSMWLTSWRWVPGWNFPGKLAPHPHPIHISEAKKRVLRLH